MLRSYVFKSYVVHVYVGVFLLLCTPAYVLGFTAPVRPFPLSSTWHTKPNRCRKIKRKNESPVHRCRAWPRSKEEQEPVDREDASSQTKDSGTNGGQSLLGFDRVIKLLRRSKESAKANDAAEVLEWYGDFGMAIPIKQGSPNVDSGSQDTQLIQKIIELPVKNQPVDEKFPPVARETIGAEATHEPSSAVENFSSGENLPASIPEFSKASVEVKEVAEEISETRQRQSSEIVIDDVQTAPESMYEADIFAGEDSVVVVKEQREEAELKLKSEETQRLAEETQRSAEEAQKAALKDTQDRAKRQKDLELQGEAAKAKAEEERISAEKAAERARVLRVIEEASAKLTAQSDSQSGNPTEVVLAARTAQKNLAKLLDNLPGVGSPMKVDSSAIESAVQQVLNSVTQVAEKVAVTASFRAEEDGAALLELTTLTNLMTALRDKTKTVGEEALTVLCDESMSEAEGSVSQAVRMVRGTGGAAGSRSLIKDAHVKVGAAGDRLEKGIERLEAAKAKRKELNALLQKTSELFAEAKESVQSLLAPAVSSKTVTSMTGSISTPPSSTSSPGGPEVLRCYDSAARSVRGATTRLGKKLTPQHLEGVELANDELFVLEAQRKVTLFISSAEAAQAREEQIRILKIQEEERAKAAAEAFQRSEGAKEEGRALLKKAQKVIERTKREALEAGVSDTPELVNSLGDGVGGYGKVLAKAKRLETMNDIAAFTRACGETLEAALNTGAVLEEALREQARMEAKRSEMLQRLNPAKSALEALELAATKEGYGNKGPVAHAIVTARAAIDTAYTSIKSDPLHVSAEESLAAALHAPATLAEALSTARGVYAQKQKEKEAQESRLREGNDALTEAAVRYSEAIKEGASMDVLGSDVCKQAVKDYQAALATARMIMGRGDGRPVKVAPFLSASKATLKAALSLEEAVAGVQRAMQDEEKQQKSYEARAAHEQRKQIQERKTQSETLRPPGPQSEAALLQQQLKQAEQRQQKKQQDMRKLGAQTEPRGTRKVFSEDIKPSGSVRNSIDNRVDSKVNRDQSKSLSSEPPPQFIPPANRYNTLSLPEQKEQRTRELLAAAKSLDDRYEKAVSNLKEQDDVRGLDPKAVSDVQAARDLLASTRKKITSAVYTNLTDEQDRELAASMDRDTKAACEQARLAALGIEKAVQKRIEDIYTYTVGAMNASVGTAHAAEKIAIRAGLGCDKVTASRVALENLAEEVLKAGAAKLTPERIQETQNVSAALSSLVHALKKETSTFLNIDSDMTRLRELARKGFAAIRKAEALGLQTKPEVETARIGYERAMDRAEKARVELINFNVEVDLVGKAVDKLIQEVDNEQQQKRETELATRSLLHRIDAIDSRLKKIKYVTDEPSPTPTRNKEERGVLYRKACVLASGARDSVRAKAPLAAVTRRIERAEEAVSDLEALVKVKSRGTDFAVSSSDTERAKSVSAFEQSLTTAAEDSKNQSPTATSSSLQLLSSRLDKALYKAEKHLGGSRGRRHPEVWSALSMARYSLQVEVGAERSGSAGSIGTEDRGAEAMIAAAESAVKAATEVEERDFPEQDFEIEVEDEDFGSAVQLYEELKEDVRALGGRVSTTAVDAAYVKVRQQPTNTMAAQEFTRALEVLEKEVASLVALERRVLGAEAHLSVIVGSNTQMPPECENAIKTAERAISAAKQNLTGESVTLVESAVGAADSLLLKSQDKALSMRRSRIKVTDKLLILAKTLEGLQSEASKSKEVRQLVMTAATSLSVCQRLVSSTSNGNNSISDNSGITHDINIALEKAERDVTAAVTSVTNSRTSTSRTSSSASRASNLRERRASVKEKGAEKESVPTQGVVNVNTTAKSPTSTPTGGLSPAEITRLEELAEKDVMEFVAKAKKEASSNIRPPILTTATSNTTPVRSKTSPSVVPQVPVDSVESSSVAEASSLRTAKSSSQNTSTPAKPRITYEEKRQSYVPLWMRANLAGDGIEVAGDESGDSPKATILATDKWETWEQKVARLRAEAEAEVTLQRGNTGIEVEDGASAENSSLEVSQENLLPECTGKNLPGAQIEVNGVASSSSESPANSETSRVVPTAPRQPTIEQRSTTAKPLPAEKPPSPEKEKTFFGRMFDVLFRD